MNRSNKTLQILSLGLIPVIIFLYFYRWKTNTIYGDDLFAYRDHFRVIEFSEKLKLFISSQKFRPISWLAYETVITFFKAHLFRYYVFNVLIQSLNTIILIGVFNTIFRRAIYATVFGLLFGLSRFGLYNITQLFCGGVLEGLAMTFFLLTLYFIINSIQYHTPNKNRVYSFLLWAILFANLAMYTHERYIVLSPFIGMIILFFPYKNVLNTQQKILGLGLSLLSVVLNVAVKKICFGMPFFVGTGGTNIKFSFKSALGYYFDGILSIIQINSGPEYLVGIPHTSLNFLFQIILVLIVVIELFILGFCIKSYLKDIKQNIEGAVGKFISFLYVFALLNICLVPAIVTIRLEQRWLQASFGAFLLLMAMAFSKLSVFENKRLLGVFSAFIILFLVSDYNYLSNGANNFYLKDAEKTAWFFKNAIDNGVIRENSDTIVVFEKNKYVNAEGALNWSVGDGYIFKFYQNKAKKVLFIDSVGLVNDTAQIKLIKNLSKNKSQVIYFEKELVDITGQF